MVYGGSVSVALVTERTWFRAAQYCPASVSASALSVPEPEKPVAAWRETMNELGPVGATLELAAHATSIAAAAITAIAITVRRPILSIRSMV